MNEWGAITVIAIGYIYLAARKKEETINLRLSNLVEKISVNCLNHETINILTNLKLNFNSFIVRLNFLLENLRQIEKDDCNEYEKCGRLLNLVNFRAECIKMDVQEKWGNEQFLFDIRKRLKYTLNAENEPELRILFYCDLEHWAWQVVNIIDKLRELTKIENKFNRHQFSKLVDDLSAISQPLLQKELKNKSNNYFCKL